MLEDFILVRGFGEFIGQVLACEVQVFVQARAPLGAIGHIVDDASARDPHARASFAGVAA